MQHNDEHYGFMRICLSQTMAFFFAVFVNIITGYYQGLLSDQEELLFYKEGLGRPS